MNKPCGAGRKRGESRIATLAMFAVALLGCTPALDWRELRPQGSEARVMFPCKPASHARRVTLAGAVIEMSLYACSANDTVFALSFADLKDPARISDALDELARAALSHIQPSRAPVSEPVRVVGMTPQQRAAQWRVSGRMADGRIVEERVALFSFGTRVYQATMLGTKLDPAAEDTFFGALRVGK